jgi:hypothetical protein
MCRSDTGTNVWMRKPGVGASAAAAASTSATEARARLVTTQSRPSSRAMAEIASASAGEDAAKPASTTSIPSATSWRANRSLRAGSSPKPGACSPSRRVVSKTVTTLAPSTPLSTSLNRRPLTIVGPRRADAPSPTGLRGA